MNASPNAEIDTLQIGMEWYPEAPGSGVARMFHGLSRHLPAQGVGVTGLVTGNGTPENRPDSIHAFAPPSASLPSRLWRLRSALQDHFQRADPQLVAAHFSLYALPLLTVARKCPLVVHFHGPWALESEAEDESALSVWGKRQVERAVYGRAQRFIVLSEAFKAVLTEHYGVAPEAVHVVPGGVDVDRFAPTQTTMEAREQLGWPTDRPVLFSVRRLVRRVGLDRLITAMQHVTEHRPDACLLIAGKGPLADALEARIEALGLADHVHLLGFVPEADLPLAYRAADLSVVPTRAFEGFGLVAVESLAAGTPAVVTPVGGLPEVVEDLSSTLVTEDASAEAIASRLLGALDRSVSLPSADACRDFAASRYDWPVIARQTRSVYEEVV